jgi:hypothetical protein
MKGTKRSGRSAGQPKQADRMLRQGLTARGLGCILILNFR